MEINAFMAVKHYDQVLFVTAKSANDLQIFFKINFLNIFQKSIMFDKFGIRNYVFRHIYANCGYFVTSQL